MSAFITGVISERAAIIWLRSRFSAWSWTATTRFSNEDLAGVDIIGSQQGAEPRYIQVKSSERYLKSYDPDVEVLIIPQDDDGPYFV